MTTFVGLAAVVEACEEPSNRQRSTLLRLAPKAAIALARAQRQRLHVFSILSPPRYQS